MADACQWGKGEKGEKMALKGKGEKVKRWLTPFKGGRVKK